MKDKLKNIFFRIWYWYISIVDKNAEVTFMNYGYSKDNQKIKLDANDEKDRYSAQLYHYVTSEIDIKGKDILEIGCGRGGGLSYLNRYLSPNLAFGIDLNKKAIEFCRKNYSNEKIKIVQANAQKLNYKSNIFDIVINIESSHRYSRMDKFLNEVFRVLKPDGVFLFADFRHESEFEDLNKQIKNSDLKLVKDENITENVLEALRLSTKERENLIRKMAPKFLHSLGRNFAATEGSSTYNKFLTGEFEYFFKILIKKQD